MCSHGPRKAGPNLRLVRPGAAPLSPGATPLPTCSCGLVAKRQHPLCRKFEHQKTTSVDTFEEILRFIDPDERDSLRARYRETKRIEDMRTLIESMKLAVRHLNGVLETIDLLQVGFELALSPESPSAS